MKSRLPTTRTKQGRWSLQRKRTVSFSPKPSSSAIIPCTSRRRELADSGAIGDVLTLRSTFCSGGSGAGPEARKPEANWRFNKAKGGGSVYDLACYCIHHARFIFGADPVRVFASSQPGLEVDDAMYILLVFPDDRTAQISVGFNTASAQYVEICGSGGMLRIEIAWNNENRSVDLEHRTSDGDGTHQL